MHKLPTAPHCPITGCTGIIRTHRKGGFTWQRCDNAECNALVGLRWLEGEEKARADADKAAKKERQKRKTQKELLAEYQAERERINALPQLPVEGWSPAEWFPGYDAREKQLRFVL